MRYLATALFALSAATPALAAPPRFGDEKTTWRGFDRYDFLMDETDLSIKPYKAATEERTWEDEDDSRPHAPARTNEELLCRQVIRWVRRLLHDTPEQAQQAMARLEAEFVEAQALPGGLRLPDPARVEPIEKLLGRVRIAAAQPPYRDPLSSPRQVEDASHAKD
jgi:hypothetical protein